MTGFARAGRPIVLAICAAGALFAAAPAQAAPQVNGTFPVTGLGVNNQITQGPDGNIWVTLEADPPNDVARINSQTGQVTKFNLDDVNTPPVGITSQGNNLWVTADTIVARFAPGSTDATVTANLALSSPSHITLGPDGNLWTVSGGTVLKIPPANPALMEPTPGLLTNGKQIVSGAGNTLWATGGTQVIHITTAPAHAAGSPYNVGGGVQGIAAGPGNQIAYGNPGGTPQSIGRITPPGAPQVTNLGSLDAGFGIAFGNDGAYWITQANANNLRRFTPQGQSTFLGGFPSAPNRGPRQIAKGPNNTLWVTLVPNNPMDTTGRVARVTGVAPTPPTPTPPPNGGCTDNQFEFGKVKKNKKKGTAKLTVNVPCPGELDLAKTKKVKADDEVAEDEGDEKLTVKPRRKAKKRLNKKGKAKVKAEVTYTPDGGDPSTQTKKLKLKKRR